MKRAAVSLIILAAVLAPACGNAPGSPCRTSFDDFPCHRAVVEGEDVAALYCQLLTIDDGQPCRTGVGICMGGDCIEPDGAPTACDGHPSNIYEGICDVESDCLSFNPCADVSCPSPGLDFCLYLSKPDGTRCAEGLTCLHGQCCVPTPDAACGSDVDCHAIEECTVSACGTSGVCIISRSEPGSSCATTNGEHGRCVQHEADIVPRCEKIGGAP